MRVEHGVVQACARQPSRGSSATGAHRQFGPSRPRRHGHPTFAQVQREARGNADALEEAGGMLVSLAPHMTGTHRLTALLVELEFKR